MQAVLGKSAEFQRGNAVAVGKYPGEFPLIFIADAVRNFDHLQVGCAQQLGCFFPAAWCGNRRDSCLPGIAEKSQLRRLFLRPDFICKFPDRVVHAVEIKRVVRTEPCKKNLRAHAELC